MSEKLKNLGEGIKTTYGFVETKVRQHFWCLLVLLLVTFILSLTKGSDTDRLSIVSSTLSIVLAFVVVIFSLLHASDMKDLVKQAWQKVEKKSEETSKNIAEMSEQMKSLSEGSMLPAIDTVEVSEADRDYQFDPKNVSWMTLISLYCISKAQEKVGEIDIMYISYEIDKDLNQKLNINYTTQGIYALLEGVIYGMMCFFPEGDIVCKENFVTVKKLPPNFSESVNKRIELEKQTERGKRVFGTLCPTIDECFNVLSRLVVSKEFREN